MSALVSTSPDIASIRQAIDEIRQITADSYPTGEREEAIDITWIMARYRITVVEPLMHEECHRAEVRRLTHDLRTRLQDVWTRRGTGADETVNALRQWCVTADSADIDALEGFVAELRSYCESEPARSSSNVRYRTEKHMLGSHNSNSLSRYMPTLKVSDRISENAAASHTPHQNHLLDALPAAEYERIASSLELVPMGLGDVIYEAGVKMKYVYFPTTAIVSLLYVMADGASAEIAIVGNEGVLGISLFMGGDSTPSRAVVQSEGHAYRLRADRLKAEFGQFGPTMELLLRYTQALITQMAQTAVCNRHHSIDQQLCRWLLLSLDRLSTNQLFMTQELIANMLGVRREGVTEAAGKLQNAGLIRYRRGRITVLDRPGLESRCCECYQVVKTEFDRLLPRATDSATR